MKKKKQKLLQFHNNIYRPHVCRPCWAMSFCKFFFLRFLFLVARCTSHETKIYSLICISLTIIYPSAVQCNVAFCAVTQFAMILTYSFLFSCNFQILCAFRTQYTFVLRNSYEILDQKTCKFPVFLLYHSTQPFLFAKRERVRKKSYSAFLYWLIFYACVK